MIEGSVTDPDAVRSAMGDCDEVYHFAAMVFVPECIERWQYGHQVNIGGTINVFEAALAAGRLPVVYASSAAVYGDQGENTCVETTMPAPMSPYGADKLGGEYHARAFWGISQLPSAGLRFFNIYGPGQLVSSPYAGVIARFCDNATGGIAHKIFGDGQQIRDFVYVADLIDVLGRCMARLKSDPTALVANVCTGHETSLLDLISTLDHVIPGSGEGVTFHDGRAGDIRYSRGDNTHLQSLIGPTDWTPMLDGLRKILTP